ncbi:MAG: LemA family protein [Elusimicrobia bacterium]|nr:LemA family protein [Elusimicrobiota bacterium]
MTRKSAIVLGILGVLVLGFIGTLVRSYNRLVTLNESIPAAWAQVENVLQRRHDLIPNLVNTVKGYMQHEQKVFTDIAAARAKLAGASRLEDKVQASAALEGALSRLLVIVENYPTLKANENFLVLQDELAGTENRIAVERRRYNEVVQAYNITIRRFPTVMVARYFGFGPRNVYFQVEEAARAVPKVTF